MKSITINNRNKVFEACVNGDINIIQNRINRNINLDFCNNYGETPLILAIMNNQNDIVKKLCEYGKIDINCIDYEGYTALYYAIENNNYENVESLLSNGANYNIILPNGDTPMSYAYMMEYNKIIRLLYDYGDTVPNNYLGLSNKRKKIDKPKKDITPDMFLLAIINNNKDDILKYLDEGYNINQRYPPHYTTPIMYTTELGNLDIIKLLCEKGADFTMEDSSGGNSLLIADMLDRQDIIEYFNTQKKLN
jgi:ankyrin repeat protein